MSIIRAFSGIFPEIFFFEQLKKKLFFLEKMKTKTQFSRDSQLLSVLRLVDDFEDFVFFLAVFMNLYTLLLLATLVRFCKC